MGSGESRSAPGSPREPSFASPTQDGLVAQAEIEQQMRKVTLLEGAHYCQRRPSSLPFGEGLENGLGLTPWIL